jgi:Ca2+-transporting ATPase
MTLGVEPARPGIMSQPPRAAGASILTGRRMARLALYGLTMAVGTLAAYAWGASGDGDHAYAVTLAFTTFVLFQFFNIFNARAEHDSAFGRQFFDNRRLWLALFGVVGLQIVVVHWAPAQAVFDTVDLTLADWILATLIASTVLVFDEVRKLAERIVRRRLSAHAW